MGCCDSSAKKPNENMAEKVNGSTIEQAKESTTAKKQKNIILWTVVVVVIVGLVIWLI